MSRSTLLLPLMTAGCLADLQADASKLFPDGTDSGGGSSTAATASTSMPGGSGNSMQTVTGEVPTTTVGPGEASTSTGEVPPNEAPVILSFAFEPAVLHEAGIAQPVAMVSEDVVTLSLELDGVEVWTGPPPVVAWTFEATSSAASDGEYEFALIARDMEGLETTAEAKLWVSLPPSGTEKCVFEEDAGTGWLNAAVYGDDALVVAGALAKPNQSLEATLWRLDPNSCQPQAGYPWAISQWTASPLVVPPSQAIGLALDELGRMAIAANIGSGLTRRPYVAVLSPEGALEWEHVGPSGQTYSGIAAAPGRIVAVGEKLVNEGPPQFDGLVESFDLEGTKMWSDTLAAPLPGDDWTDDLNTFDERPRGVVWQQDLETLMVVGERQVQADPFLKWTRAFSAQYSLNGAILGAWTSSGLDADEDGIVSAAYCGDDLLAAGWVQDGQNNRAPATRWFDSQGNGETRRLDALTDSTMQDLACDQEQKIWSAATSNEESHILAFKGSDGPLTVKQKFPNITMWAVDCDARGFCAVVGLKGDRAWVRVNHP